MELTTCKEFLQYTQFPQQTATKWIVPHLLVIGDNGNVRDRIDVMIGEVHLEKLRQRRLRRLRFRNPSIFSFAMKAQAVDHATWFLSRNID